MARKRHKRIPVLTKKVLTGVILSGLVLFIVLSIAGQVTFTKHFRENYDDHLRSIAIAAQECLDSDNFEQYLNTKERTASYERVKSILDGFVRNFDLNMIYVSVPEGPDYTKITYIYNPVNPKSRFHEFPLGYQEIYIQKDYNTSAKAVMEEGKIIVRHTLKTRSGSHITSMSPVYDSNGNIIAVLGAQKSIQEFVSSVRQYLAIISTVCLIFTLCFITIFTYLFNRGIIKPIIIVTKESDRFSSLWKDPAENLLNINNRDELGILAHSFYQMEKDMCTYIEDLKNVTAEKERISTELNVATKIQSDMLPKGYPAIPERTDFDLYATMEPAKEVGGDLYDYILLDQDHLLLIVGDVSGKGVPAALFMVVAKTLLDSHAIQKLSPQEIFSVTNNQLSGNNESGMFVTCWLGILEFSTGELKYVNAGHPAPVLFHDGEYKFLDTKPNFVLGGMEGLPYKEHTIHLDKGDRLFVYSDGVTEATNAQEQLFGDQNLLYALKNTKNLNSRDVIKEVRNQIDGFVKEAEQFDDITMLNFIWHKEESTLNPGSTDSEELSTTVSVPASEANLIAVNNFINSHLEPYDIPVGLQTKIELVVEELFVNIAKYAYKDNTGTVQIDCHVSQNPNVLHLTFKDSGIPFNPLAKKDPDVTLSAEDREIGGLGIFLTKKYMDTIDYQYENKMNVLTLTKNL